MTIATLFEEVQNLVEVEIQLNEAELQQSQLDLNIDGYILFKIVGVY